MVLKKVCLAGKFEKFASGLNASITCYVCRSLKELSLNTKLNIIYKGYYYSHIDHQFHPMCLSSEQGV